MYGEKLIGALGSCRGEFQGSVTYRMTGEDSVQVDHTCPLILCRILPGSFPKN
jgi:hypothetical protein